MAGTTNYLQNHELDFELRGQAFSPVATEYVALFTCTNGVVARSTAYALNNTVTVTASDGKQHLYKVTTAGTTAATAPTYPGVSNEVITDGTAVLTEQTSVLEAGTITEVSGGAYARASIASSLAAWSGTQGAGTTAASSGTSATISNNVAVNFPTPTANWSTLPVQVCGFMTFDAATAGNPLRYGLLTSNQNISTGNTVSFAAGSLTIVFDK